MITVTADLHLHSVLSPCGELSMSPTAIAEIAAERGLGLVGLSDHNSARNTPALRDAAKRIGVKALYGLEVRTAEEVDVLTIFDEVEAATAFGEWVWASLPDAPCLPEVYGDQVVVDAEENILEFVPRLLINGIGQPIEAVCGEAAARGALVLLAHVDRPSDSVISQLGWLPEGLAVDGAEVSRFGDETLLARDHPWLADLPVVRFSDAHRPAEIGYQQTRFHIAEGSVSELRAALRGVDGRWAEPVRQALR